MKSLTETLLQEYKANAYSVAHTTSGVELKDKWQKLLDDHKRLSDTDYVQEAHDILTSSTLTLLENLPNLETVEDLSISTKIHAQIVAKHGEIFQKQSVSSTLSLLQIDGSNKSSDIVENLEILSNAQQEAFKELKLSSRLTSDKTLSRKFLAVADSIAVMNIPINAAIVTAKTAETLLKFRPFKR